MRLAADADATLNYKALTALSLTAISEVWFFGLGLTLLFPFLHSPLRHLRSRYPLLPTHATLPTPSPFPIPPVLPPLPLLRSLPDFVQFKQYEGKSHFEMKTVTHPSTNRARRALTSFMRRTPLTTTPRRQPKASDRQASLSCPITSGYRVVRCSMVAR